MDKQFTKILHFKHQTDRYAFTPGQTLIETIVAIGLLTTGIVGGLSLAIFALAASDTTLNQIIATNLAREGAEVVRNMRDSNWRADDLDPSCSDGNITIGPCYPNWDRESAIITGSTGGNGNRVRMSINPAPKLWAILPNNNLNQAAIFLQSDGTYNDQANGSAQFYRYINIISDTNAPFTASNPRLIVRSTVWWTGKRCASVTNVNNINTSCKVVVEEYLTNWKNY